jgi:hypothetical protein
VLGYNSTYFSNKIHKGKACYSEEQVINTPFEIFAREYMEYFHKDKFNCKKNQNCHIVANVRYLLIWEVKLLKWETPRKDSNIQFSARVTMR